MDLTKAMELFEELKRRISEHGDYLRESEYRTRILLIDPLLQMLGWDVEDFHCVEIEYRTAQSVNERADYVLKNGESKVAIVEAKRLGTVISSAERRQAKEYADYADASQCVLTDGGKWMLYDLNQGRNPDTMQPSVEFDIENDVSEQLVLRCLALWRPNFTSEVGFLPVSNPFFGPSVDSDQSETNRATNEPPEQQPPDDSPENSDSWCTFELKLYLLGTTPIRLKIGADINEPVNYWLDVIHKVVAWLVDEEILGVNDCPIGTEKYTFIGREAVNPDGTPFKRPQSLSSDLILQRGYVNTQEQWRKVRQLLDQFGVDKSTIRVSYEPTGQASS